MIKKVLAELKSRVLSKQGAKLRFWKNEIARYEEWFEGRLSPLYNTPSPQTDEKVRGPNAKDSAILTWHKLHQEPKYLADLGLKKDAFQGKTLLDIGAGPIPSATCFEGADLHCLEPLLPRYLEAGFPLHYYGKVSFIHAASEEIPAENGSFDAVIAVNAIDHVDDIKKTAREVQRVLKQGGLFRMHVHVHPPTTCEPLELNDERFLDLFGWCPGLGKVSDSREGYSANLPEGERFVLWSNF